MQKLNSRIGIIQGRLSVAPPKILQHFPSNWIYEFGVCSSLGLNYIELLVEETYNHQNPVWSAPGRQNLLNVANTAGISLYSMCLDSVISKSIDTFSDGELEFLFAVAKELNIRVLVLPLMGHSVLTPASLPRISSAMQRIAPKASRQNIQIALESLAEPHLILELLRRTGAECINIVFDTGNRINASDDICSEIAALLHHICHVHIKDRDRLSNNVQLGTGIVPFGDIFRLLLKAGYSGAFTFETCRGEDPVDTAQYNLKYLESFGIYPLHV